MWDIEVSPALAKEAVNPELATETVNVDELFKVIVESCDNDTKTTNLPSSETRCDVVEQKTLLKFPKVSSSHSSLKQIYQLLNCDYNFCPKRYPSHVILKWWLKSLLR